MSDTFVVVVFLAMVALVFWRVALLVMVAILIAIAVTGFGAVAKGVTGGGERTVVQEPAPRSGPVLVEPTR
jgi:hypothetical protein